MPRCRIRTEPGPRHPIASSPRVLREESARIVAALTGWLGSLDLAEESVAEAIEEALREWRTRGVPPNPGGWLTQAARHNALDRIRREKRYREKLALLAEPEAAAPDRADEPDERLPLLFGCCHPALSPDAQLALTLRAICGLTTAQIARATLTPEATIAQRIVRAKRKIGATGIPLRIPEGAERAERLDHRAHRRVGDVQRGAPRRGRRRHGGSRPRRRRDLARARRGCTRCRARRRPTDCSRCCCSTAHARVRAPWRASSCCWRSRTARAGTAR